MFTGLVQAVGKIQSIGDRGRDKYIRIDVGNLSMEDVGSGDSIAVNGVCLTALDIDAHSFAADVSAETIEHSIFKNLGVGAAVNLEKSLMPSSKLGGHFVSGHVDGVGEIIQRYADGRSERFVVRTPPALSKYIAPKGSICISGISLTVNEVNRDAFGVNIVPHTLKETILGDLHVGDKVNLEVDIIARYLEQLLKGGQGADGVSEALLADAGFIKNKVR
ncbi:MAG: riboflavin synthase [Gammaproteobacteria bacterium]|nr:riboflavin synthase [Gammaproteobacteria bacterium]